MIRKSLAIIFLLFSICMAGCDFGGAGEISVMDTCFNSNGWDNIRCGEYSDIYDRMFLTFSFKGIAPADQNIVMNAPARTITVVVPEATNVSSLVAVFTVYSYYSSASSVVIGSTPQVSGTTSNNFTTAQTYTISNNSSSSTPLNWTVSIIRPSYKSITEYSLRYRQYANMWSYSYGTIDEINKTISVTVPFGTDVTSLAAIFTTTGQSVKIGNSVQISESTENNFTNPVIYKVTARDNSTVNYTVTVTVSPATNSNKAITAYSINGVAGTINEAAKTISVTLPSGTTVSSLIATFSSTGQSVSVIQFGYYYSSQSSGITANNFTNPVVYRVTATDASYVDYTVTVTVALPNSNKAITAYSINGVAGTINEAAKTISVIFPFGTTVTSLVATFTITGLNLKVAGSVQTSGTTTNNFTSSVVYLSTATDNSTVNYTVTVILADLPVVTTSAIAGNLTFTTSIVGTSAKGGGNVTSAGGSSVTDRGLCWNTTGSPTISNSHASDGTPTGTGVFSNTSISGLSVNTTYYVRAYVTNSAGTSYGSQVIFNSGKTFGTDYAGGYVFYNDGNAHGLVSSKTDVSAGIRWYNGSYTTTGATGTAIGTGLSNTNTIISSQGATATSYAAGLARAYNGGSYNDWYLPSTDELCQLCVKLKTIGGISDEYYWSSSEASPNYAWSQQNGFQYAGNYKMYTLPVRAIRAF